MADKPDEPEVPKGFTSTAVGAATNEPVTGEQYRPGKQTPDQFFNGDEMRPENFEAPKNHATKGMTSLGYSEASRLEDTAAQQEADRKAAEKAAAKAAAKED